MLIEGMRVAKDAHVMILGVYHFANPGRDAVKVHVDDHLAPAKQVEIAEVVDALARFEPTKIAVESSAMDRAALHEQYCAYLEGAHELDRSETQQLGFRLAARFGHSEVYPIDDMGRLYMGFDRMLSYAQEHDPEAHELFHEAVEAAEADSRKAEARGQTVRETLRHLNACEADEADHGMYVWFTKIGVGQCYAGADVLTAWYDRNIRIFTNLVRVLEDGDRVLVIYGSGHTPILRQLVSAAPGLELADPLSTL